MAVSETGESFVSKCESVDYRSQSSPLIAVVVDVATAGPIIPC